MHVTTGGVDLAKHVFQVHGIAKDGTVSGIAKVDDELPDRYRFFTTRNLNAPDRPSPAALSRNGQQNQAPDARRAYRPPERDRASASQ